MRTILPFPTASPESPVSGVPLQHRPWCDVPAHLEYASEFVRGCASPRHSTVLPGGVPVTAYVIERVDGGPVDVVLLDTPGEGRLTLAAVEQLARFLESLVDLAIGTSR